MTRSLNIIQLFVRPRYCVECGKLLQVFKTPFCLNCLSKIQETNFEQLQDNAMFQRLKPYGVKHAASYMIFEKDGISQKIIHQIKYQGDKRLGQYAGEWMANKLIFAPFIHQIDYLVPIPLHKKRFHRRGFNQSELLAESMSSILHLPVETEQLQRVVNTKSQISMSHEEREKNTENIFRITNPEIFSNKHILLIDDVYTTGATMTSAIDCILQRCTNTSISVYTLAYV